MIAGYARVSTKDQSVDVQVAQLRALGCDEIYTDQISGKTMKRTGLIACLDRLQSGDMLVVQAFDRLGRSLPDLLKISGDLNEKGVQLRSIREGVDTSSPFGKMYFTLTGAFAQFERDLISQRTKIGLAAAKDQGRVGGRPKALSDVQRANIEQMILTTTQTFRELAELYQISVATLYKAFPGGRAALVKTRFKIVSDFSVSGERFQIVEDNNGSGFYWRLEPDRPAEHRKPHGPFQTQEKAIEACNIYFLGILK